MLKADGLAAGKGVIICASEDEAKQAIETFFVERRFGETEVVLEEHLDGTELSLLALCDGENVLPLAPAQDYKRISDGDLGPNTGGMGSYSPVAGFDAERVDRLADMVHRPIVELMGRRGTPFAGVLYAGLMLTEAGPKVLEYNCRFGDPETQAVLPRLESDLLELCFAAREPGGLSGAQARFSPEWAVTVVLASAGYPELVDGRSDHRARLGSGRRRGHARRYRARRRRYRHRRRAGAERDRARADARRGPRPRLRRRRADRVRRHADAH